MPNQNRVLVKTAKNGEHYYEHQYANGQIGPVSETYQDQSGAIAAAQNEYPGLPVIVVPPEDLIGEGHPVDDSL